MKKELVINSEMDVDYIEKEVSNILIRLGVSANLRGYFFLKDAIIICVQDQEYAYGVTKKLYPKLKKIHNIGDVDRNIRTAIDHAYRKGINYMYELFNYSDYILNNKPTVTEFVSTVSEIIRLNMTKNKEEE